MSTLGLKALAFAKTNVNNPHAVEKPKGSNRGDKIDVWNQRVGVPLGSPWCLSFVWCMVEDACESLGLTNLILRTGSCTAQFNFCKKNGLVTKSPQPGDIFLVRGKGEYVHTGFVTSVGDTTVETCEGNTNKGGSPEGYAVFERTRKKSTLVFIRI